MSVIRVGNPLRRTSLITDITDGLQQTNRLKRTHLFASDAGFCHRKATMMRNAPDDMTETVDASGTLYMAIGSAIHTTLVQSLKRTGKLMGAEIRIQDAELELSGYIDLVVRTDDGPMLVEVKTCGVLPSRPKDWHYEQAMVYSLITGVPAVTLLYVSRNVASYDGHLLMQPIVLDPAHSDYVLIAQRLAAARYYSKLGKLGPIPDHIRSERSCGFCPFRSICWGSAPSFLPYASLTERSAITAQAARDADRLVGGMEERRTRFLAQLDGTK